MSEAKRNVRKRTVMAAAAAALTALAIQPGTGRAATRTWDGGANDGIFNSASNWDTNVAPATTDDVVFTNVTPVVPSITAAFNAATQINSLTFTATAPPVTLNTTNTNRLTMNGRTGDDIIVLGGSHVIAETDGIISPNIGFRYSNTGGSFDFNIASGAQLEIAARINQTNSADVLSLSGGGTLVISATNNGGTAWNNSGGTGFSVNSGTLVFRNPANGATGNTANKFVVNNGGVIQLESNYGSSNGNLNVNSGGIIRSTGTATSIVAGTGSVVLSGTTTFDVLDNSLALNQDISGGGNLVKTGTGTLRLNASDNSYTGNVAVNVGTLSIGATATTNTLGNITVQAGATIDATAAGLALAANQRLGGTGTVNGNVTVNASSTLAPALVGTAGTLTLGNDLTIAGGTVHVDLDTTPGGTNDQLAIAGALNVTGPTLLSINRYNGSLAAGTYTLATFAGAFSGSVGNFTLPTVRQTLTLVDPNTNPGKIDLIVGAGGSANLVWAGNGTTNVWKTNDSVNNFLNGESPDKFFDWDDVTFTDAGSNSPSVNIQGLIQPSTVTVNNSNKNYTFSGSGTMASVNNLIKSGTGTLTIANADGNAITQVNVGGGSLMITNANTIGTLNANSGGKVVLANASANAGSISTANANAGGTIVFGNGTTSHTLGSLNVNSGGTLTFANTIANTIGTLNILPGGTVNIGDGVTAGVGNAGAAISNNQGTVVYNQPGDWTSATVIGGSGTVQKLGTGVVSVTGANTYTGPTVITSGVIKVNNNAALGALPGGSVTVTDGGSFDVGGFTTADTANFGQKLFLISGNGIPSAGIGALADTNPDSVLDSSTPSKKVTLTADATVGGPNRIEVRAPTAAPNTAVLDLAGFTLTKIGTSTFGIARADTTPGNIHVTAGTLNIEGSTNMTGAGTLTFDTGSTGQFNQLTGTVSRNIVLNGGTITDTSTSSSTSVPSNISLAASSNINVNSPGGLTLPSVISGTAGYNKTGTGMLTITASNTYSGMTSINNGLLSVGSSANLGNASATNNLGFGGATGGTLLTTGAVASPGRSMALNAAGTIDTNGFDSSFGPIDGTGSFTKAGAGSLTVTHVISGNLTVNAGVLSMAPDSNAVGVSHVGALTVIGKLNLAANKLITTSPAGSWSGSNYTDVTALVASGRGTGNLWDGATGIVTNQSAAVGSNFTSIGVARASDVRPTTASATELWAGQTITGTDTLVMYTYGGDANLDGKINVDDYIKIDSGIAAGLTGWSNGDFNYDGKVNIDDYTTVIDANIGNQNGVFPTSAGLSGGVGGVSAVPEPASFTLIGAATLSLLSRRARRGCPSGSA